MQQVILAAAAFATLQAASTIGGSSALIPDEANLLTKSRITNPREVAISAAASPEDHEPCYTRADRGSCTRDRLCQWVDPWDYCLPRCSEFTSQRMCDREMACRSLYPFDHESQARESSAGHFCVTDCTLGLPLAAGADIVGRQALDAFVETGGISCAACATQSSCQMLKSKMHLSCDWVNLPSAEEAKDYVLQRKPIAVNGDGHFSLSMCIDRSFTQEDTDSAQKSYSLAEQSVTGEINPAAAKGCKTASLLGLNVRIEPAVDELEPNQHFRWVCEPGYHVANLVSTAGTCEPANPHVRIAHCIPDSNRTGKAASTSTAQNSSVDG